jgi:hypothetical protein
MDGTGEIEERENVVRLPRDWVGPPEELVPVGPAARARAREAAAERARVAGHLTEDDGDLGVDAASDFWGEGTGALQQPVARPAVEAPRDRPRRRLRRPPLPRRPRLRRRSAMAVGMLLAAVAVVVVIVSLGSRGGSPRSRSASAGTGTLVQFAPLRNAVAGGTARLHRQMDRAAALAEQRRSAVRGRAVYVRVQRLDRDAEAERHRRAAARRPVPPASAAGSVGSTTEADAASVTSPVVTTTAAPEPSPTSSTPSSTPTTTSSATSSTAGATHRAFGVGGLLGSGHATGG